MYKQPQSYHDFANDTMDILSNLPFVLLGIYGLIYGRKEIEWTIFYLGVLLIGIGSAYYHSDPKDNTLVWDRLAMTIAFMAFFYIFLKANYNIHQYWLYIFLIIGALSVFYWVWSEDLIPYGIVQFLPPLIMAIISFQNGHIDQHLLIGGILFAMSKMFEALDKRVYSMTGNLISGHTIKHLLSAGTIYSIFLYSRN